MIVYLQFIVLLLSVLLDIAVIIIHQPIAMAFPDAAAVTQAPGG